MKKKIIFASVTVFLAVCAAKSLIAYQKAIQERDAAMADKKKNSTEE